MGPFLGVQYGLRGPTLLVAGQLLGLETHLFPLEGHFCPLPYMLHHEKSGTEKSKRNRKLSLFIPAREMLRFILIDRVLTSSVMMVAMERPISWYC